jgi:hypothetical protein
MKKRQKINASCPAENLSSQSVSQSGIVPPSVYMQFADQIVETAAATVEGALEPAHCAILVGVHISHCNRSRYLPRCSGLAACHSQSAMRLWLVEKNGRCGIAEGR